MTEFWDEVEKIITEWVTTVYEDGLMPRDSPLSIIGQPLREVLERELGNMPEAAMDDAYFLKKLSSMSKTLTDLKDRLNSLEFKLDEIQKRQNHNCGQSVHPSMTPVTPITPRMVLVEPPPKPVKLDGPPDPPVNIAPNPPKDIA